MAGEMTKEMASNVEATFQRALTTLEEKVKPSHTALIVVDVQNDFCAEGGMMHREGMDLGMAQKMVPRLVKLIEKARKMGVTIIFIQNTF